MADILPGYPQAEGAKMGSVIEWAGPSSYTQVTPGSPPTGGQAIEAKDFGLKYIEHVESQLDATGAYRAEFTPKVAGKYGVESGILAWTVVSTGAEVAAETNLSAKKVKLRAIGLA
jgi:hypothetical protein